MQHGFPTRSLKGQSERKSFQWRPRYNDHGNDTRQLISRSPYNSIAFRSLAISQFFRFTTIERDVGGRRAFIPRRVRELCYEIRAVPFPLGKYRCVKRTEWNECYSNVSRLSSRERTEIPRARRSEARSSGMLFYGIENCANALVLSARNKRFPIINTFVAVVYSGDQPSAYFTKILSISRVAEYRKEERRMASRHGDF